jgi:PleD family two-component response regulator
METLMQEADQALYEAKDLGRDRVVAARVGEPGRLQEAAE